MHKWNSETKKKVKERIVSDSFSDITFGSDAIYFPISKHVGVKIFLCKKNRDFSYSNQKRAEKYGIAPKVGDKFKISVLVINCDDNNNLKDAYKRPLFGFLTQNTPTVDDTGDTYSDVQKKELLQKMKELGMNGSDLNDRNLAVSNNKLLCVDFDMHSQKINT